MKNRVIILIIAFIVVLPLTIIFSVKNLTEAYTRLIIPSETPINFNTGEYKIFHEYLSVIDGKAIVTDKKLPKIQINIYSKTTGEAVPLERSTSSHYSVNNRAGYSIYKFNIRSQGVYVFSAAFDNPKNDTKIVFAISKNRLSANILLIILVSFFIVLIILNSNISRNFIYRSFNKSGTQNIFDNIEKIEDIKGRGFYVTFYGIARIKGQGDYWFDSEGLYFRMYLTKKPVFIPYDKMLNVDTGTCDTGELGARYYNFVLINWDKDGSIRESAIAFSNNQEDNIKVKDYILLRKQKLA